MSKKLIIAVDGPAGSGKSSTFQIVSQKLGYNFVDTGLMYRSFTLLALKKDVDFNNIQDLINLLSSFDYCVTQNQIYLNGVNVTSELNNPNILKNINKVTSIPQIREYMVHLQRNMAKNYANRGLIMVGRDITSVVLPKADLKVYLNSSIEKRAQRRLEQNYQSINDLEKIKSQIKNRDYEDTHRATGPLKITKDSWYLDNSDLSLEDTIRLIVDKIHQLEQ